MSELEIEVQQREATGKGPNRRLRTAGRIPAVVYGGGRDPLPIEVEKDRLRELLRSRGSEHAVFLLKLGGSGKSRHTMIREMQVDPVTREILHVDFQRVSLDQKVRVAVEVELIGVAEGVKNEGGVLDFVTREVEIESLPGEIPDRLTLDVSALHIGQHLEIGALEIPEGVTLLDEPEKVVVSVGHPRIVEEEVEEEEELLEAELEEPELIRRGKAAEEAEEDEAAGEESED